MTITNNNYVSIRNYTNQFASSGNANVSGNTTGGSATSGNASNSNETNTCVAINNSTSGIGRANCPPSDDGGGSGGSDGNGGPASNGGGGGQVLGVTTASMVGGKGAFSALPSTGMRDGINLWVLTSLLALIGGAIYWNKAIAPKLKALRK